MWKEILAFGKQLFALTRRVQQHDEEITALRQEMRNVGQEIKELHERIDELAESIQRLSFEVERDRVPEVVRVGDAVAVRIAAASVAPGGTPSSR